MQICRLSIALVLFANVSWHARGFRQPHDYLQAFRTWHDGFLNPGPIIQMVRSPALADDVVGRIDVTTNFVGNQLNTEYMYGLWEVISQDTNTSSLLGSIGNPIIQTLVIEPPMFSASAIADLAYPTINFTLPVQIDIIIRFNDQLKIQSYDATFRRLPEAFAYLLPKLAPQLAKELNVTYKAGETNTTSLVALRAATDICGVANQYCVGNNTQYESHDQCMNFLTKTIPFGQVWEGGYNTVWCRYIHKNMVKFRPEVHCPHIGPSGGDMCIARDYINVVEGFPFSSTLVAPNASYSATDMSGLSVNTVDQLFEASSEMIVSTTVAFYSVPTMLLFALLYLISKAADLILSRASPGYSKLSLEHKRNTVTYLINTIFTTIALGFQLAASPSFAREYTYRGQAFLKISATIVSAIYIFEMCYRPTMRFPLLCHHFCTLLAIMSLFISVEVTAHPATITAGLIWLFQATTEQSIFVGLFLHRLNYPRHLVRRVLRFAAVQSYVVKCIFAVYLIIWWATNLAKYEAPTDIYFSIVICFIGSLLLILQTYSSWAVWCIARNNAASERDIADIKWGSEALRSISTSRSSQ